MTQSIAMMKSDDKQLQRESESEDDFMMPVHVVLKVKSQKRACLVCTSWNPECYEIYRTHMDATGVSVLDCLCKITNTDLQYDSSKYICKMCFKQLNVLEQLAIQYNRLKNTFNSLIKKNPLFNVPSSSLRRVKTEKYGAKNTADGNVKLENEAHAVLSKKRKADIDNSHCDSVLEHKDMDLESQSNDEDEDGATGHGDHFLNCMDIPIISVDTNPIFESSSGNARVKSSEVLENPRLQKNILHIPIITQGKSNRGNCHICTRNNRQRKIHLKCDVCDEFLCSGECWKTWHTEKLLPGRNVMTRKSRRRKKE